MELVCVYSKSLQFKYDSEEEMNLHIDRMEKEGYNIEYKTAIRMPGKSHFYDCIFTKESN